MITAEMVSKLREMTGAGILDCKKALTEVGGDLDAAVELLRKKGIAKASGKLDRAAADGAVAGAISVDGKVGVLIEVNSETDFVAKSDRFQDLCRNVLGAALSFDGGVEAFKSSLMPSGKSVADEVVGNAAVIGENITLRRTQRLLVDSGVVAVYLHNQSAEGLGKIGVLVALESDIDQAKLKEIGKHIAMHIAAARPEALSVEDLDAKVVAKEREIAREQALASGKPESVVEKMVEGRIVKFYEQVVLLEQLFVMDGKTKITDLLSAFGKENGGSVVLKSFVRFELGEGIEQKKTDLAAEVAALTAK
jgi:elongation factor Ts